MFRFTRKFVQRFRQERLSQAAASLAFTTLLGLVPLLAIAVVVISRFDFFAPLGEALRAFLLANLLPDTAGKVIAAYAVQFTQKTARLTLTGSALLVATAVLLMLSIDRVFNRIWRVGQPRPLVKRVLVYLAALALAPVVLGLVVASATYLLTASLGLLGDAPRMTALLFEGLAATLVCAMFALLYYAMPNRPVRPLHALLGGLVTALGLDLMRRAFGYYLAKMSTYTLIYGAFAAVPIFLVWLYLSWLVVLVAALTTAQLGDSGGGRRA
jgi:membrane protein